MGVAFYNILSVTDGHNVSVFIHYLLKVFRG